MKFMLDSNVVIAIALATGETIRKRMSQRDEGDFVMSAITYAEVIHGSQRGKPPLIPELAKLVRAVPVVPFDADAARTYALLPFERASYDRLIAAHAIALDLMLITADERHFSQIPGLKVENWGEA